MKIAQKKNPAKGFTLVEIIVVISIMVVLMSMTFGVGAWALGNAKIEKCRAQVNLLQNRLQAYEFDNGSFPKGNGGEESSARLFEALYQDGIDHDRKVYMPELDPKASDQFKNKIRSNGVILDPFKHKKPYYYLRGLNENGEEIDSAYNPDFDLWSLGPNGIGRKDGEEFEAGKATEDDIGNW